jgi:hypothetical protein
MIRCPKCGDTNCRASPWQNDAEKQEHKGLQAWRCHACLHRFHHRGNSVLDRMRDNPVVATVGGSTLLVVVVVTVIIVIWSGREQEGPDRWRSPDEPRATQPAASAETHALPRGRPFGTPDSGRQDSDGNPTSDTR